MGNDQDYIKIDWYFQSSKTFSGYDWIKQDLTLADKFQGKAKLCKLWLRVNLA